MRAHSPCDMLFCAGELNLHGYEYDITPYSYSRSLLLLRTMHDAAVALARALLPAALLMRGYADAHFTVETTK